MENIVIREAVPRDISPLAELCGQLGYPCASEEVREYLDQISKTEGHQVYVAVNSENQVVGWIHVFKTYRLMTQPFAELGGLVVSSSIQSTGIGTQLLRTAEEWALRMDCASMRVRSNVLRAGAHQFYEHMGFRVDKTQRVFVKDL
jgi:GNAT superfamily N-acetyltransferase